MRKLPFGLLKSALLYNLDAHRSNPVNFWSGALGMIVNNVLYLAGMWAMLFVGKGPNQSLQGYYLALNAMVMLSWGSVCFFSGGLRDLGTLIEEGSLEPMLATPKHPLFLSAISQSHAVSAGDLLMGTGLTIWLGFLFGPAFALKTFLAAGISALAFMGLFILAGTLAFFASRGSAVGNLVIETMLSLSVYPSGKVFPDGRGRALLLLTPAAATGVLPIEAVESAGGIAFLWAGLAAVLLFSLGVLAFRHGMRRYRAVSWIGARA